MSWSYIIDLSFLSFFIWNHFFSFFLSKILAYYSRWLQFKIVVFFVHIVFLGLRYYCAFQKHELWSSKAAFTIGCFSLPSIIIRITSNQPWNTNTRNGSKSPNHKSQTMTFWIRWSKLLFLRDPLRWLTATKNPNVSWLLNLRIRVFMKSAARTWSSSPCLRKDD